MWVHVCSARQLLTWVWGVLSHYNTFHLTDWNNSGLYNVFWPNPFFFILRCTLITHSLHGCIFWSRLKHLRGASWTQLTVSWLGSPFVDICMTNAPPLIWSPQRELKSFFEAQCYIRGNSRDNALCVLYLSSLQDLQKYNWATWIYLGTHGRTFCQ